MLPCCLRMQWYSHWQVLPLHPRVDQSREDPLATVRFRRPKRDDDTFHHCPAVVPQIRFGIGHAVLPAGKQFAVATLHDGFFVLVMQIPFISGPRRVCFCEIRQGKRIECFGGRFAQVRGELERKLHVRAGAKAGNMPSDKSGKIVGQQLPVNVDVAVCSWL